MGWRQRHICLRRSISSGGGSGGGYARKRVTGLLTGQTIPVTVGAGGTAGNTGGVPPSAGGTSSFGTYVSATGGSLNPLANVANPQNGATPSGMGVAGDVNIAGSAGQAGVLNQGGLGGAAPMGGCQNSGTWGLTGAFPGRRRIRCGNRREQRHAIQRSTRAGGLVVVRW